MGMALIEQKTLFVNVVYLNFAEFSYGHTHTCSFKMEKISAHKQYRYKL